jgi:hypothetical protein
MRPSGQSSVKEIYSFCPKSGPSKEIVLPIADLYILIVEGTIAV